MLERRDENLRGLIANRFKPIRSLRANVFHARDGRRHVAIELVAAADHDLAQLRRALAVANAIDHPNLCRPREVVDAGDQLVIVTELVEGVSIGDRLMVGPFDPLHVGALVVELLSVLSRIHDEGLAHGAISATTVMIDATGTLRLIDLGVLRGSYVPTMRGDLDAVGALAATMLAGYLGSMPAQLTSWIARCSDRKQPFADAAAASTALIASSTASRTLMDLSLPAKQTVTIPPRPESRVAIKIPTLDQLTVAPLVVVPVEPSSPRRAHTPNTMIQGQSPLVGPDSAQSPATPATVGSSPGLASLAAPNESSVREPDVIGTSTPSPTAPTIARPSAPEGSQVEPVPSKWLIAGGLASLAAPSESSVREPDVVGTSAPSPTAPTISRSSAPEGSRVETVPSKWLIAGGVAAITAAIVVWIVWSQRGTEEPDFSKPSVVWKTERIEMPPTPNALRPRPPLPTGAIDPSTAPDPVILRAVPATSATVTIDVPFGAEAAWLESAAKPALEDAYRQLLQRPLARVELVGFSSNDGNEARNVQLAIGRALAVKHYLVDRGIETTRIAVAMRTGEADPTSNDTADGRARNRRAEIRFLAP